MRSWLGAAAAPTRGGSGRGVTSRSQRVVGLVSHSDLGRTVGALRRLRAAVRAADAALLPLGGGGFGAPLLSAGAAGGPATAADLCLVLGGDGTILRALRGLAGTDVPVLGVNLGTKGFLAAYEVGEIEVGVRAALDGHIERTRALTLTATRPSGGPTARGVNDVSVVASSPHRRRRRRGWRSAWTERS
jgi:NAD+ kinase